ncbi:MAG: hypothetical protein Q7T30_03010 [Planctomycetota bacterium]|nr:hypothetical protein [Planctomycetota bacterium]
MRSLFPAVAKRCVVVALPLVLTSCFTMMLWGFGPAEDVGPVSGDEETAFEYDEQTEWSWGLFFGRLGLTPFAIVLDVLTCPVQCFVFGWDDEDDDSK